MSAPAEIVLYTTTFASTVKIRSDISKIKHILTSKKITYEEVDLTELPHRRRDMLAHSDNNPVLPQLHVNNRFIGTVDELQEFEDWGDLDAILRGVSPGKLAADAAAAFHAETAAAVTAAPIFPSPRFTLDAEEEEEEEEEAEEVEAPSAEGSDEELEIAVAVAGAGAGAGAAAAVVGDIEEVGAVLPEEEEVVEAEEAFIGVEGEPEAAADGDGDSERAAAEEPLDEPDQHSLTVSLAYTVELEGEEEESPLGEEEVAASTPDRAAPEESLAHLIQSPISPLSDVDTEVPHGDDPGVSNAAPEEQEEQEELPAAPAAEDSDCSELSTHLKAHCLGEDLHAHPVQGELFPSPEKRPQSGDSSSGPDDGHLII